MTDSNGDRPRAHRIPAAVSHTTSSTRSELLPREGGPFRGWTTVQKVGALVGSLALVAGVAVAASALMGQTTSPDVPTTSSTEAPAGAAASAAPATENEAPSGAGEADTPVPILQAQFTSDQGYQYEVEMLAPTLSVRSDIANAPPGKAYVSSSSLATFVVHNENPGRNAPIPLMTTFPLWKADSPICGYLQSTRVPALSGSDDYCGPGVLFGVQLMAPPGQRLDSYVYWPSLDIDASAELIGFYDIHEGALSVEEKDVDAILSALESPDAFVLAAKVDPDDAANYACQLGDTVTIGRHYVVASTAPLDGC